MHAEDVLFTLAQIGAAFAGFGGIVAALGARSIGELSIATRFRFRNLLIVSIGASLFALVPAMLEVAGARASLVWSLSSAVLGVCTLGNLLAARHGARRVFSLNPRLLRPWMAVLSTSVQTAICIAQAANVLGWPFGSGGTPYVSSIFALLVLAGIQFVLLALDSTPSDSPAIRPDDLTK
jgi:hypothetical protein